jgi:hypothetical protein
VILLLDSCGCSEEVGPFPQQDQPHNLHGALTTGGKMEQNLEDELKKRIVISNSVYQ